MSVSFNPMFAGNREYICNKSFAMAAKCKNNSDTVRLFISSKSPLNYKAKFCILDKVGKCIASYEEALANNKSIEDFRIWSENIIKKAKNTTDSKDFLNSLKEYFSCIMK